VAYQVLVDQNHQELPIFSKPPLHGAPTIHDTCTGTRGRTAGKIAPRVKTTVTGQIVSAVSAFLLGADAEARDKEPSRHLYPLCCQAFQRHEQIAVEDERGCGMQSSWSMMFTSRSGT